MTTQPPPAVILITGASAGLGRALAVQYASVGVTLILHGRNVQALADVAAACKERGASPLILAADVADCPAFMQSLADLEEANRIDLAIINAGVANLNHGDGESWPDIENLLDINVRGALATVAVVLPGMRRRGRGQIALISSLAAYHGLSVSPAYCASKAALKAYGEALRSWLAPQGIAVNVVLPGFVKTAMSDRFPSGKPFLLAADDAARRIQRGLARNQARIAFPTLLSIGSWLLAVLPASWSQHIVRHLGF